jgi:lysosomal Pro-X carboxypeptidase
MVQYGYPYPTNFYTPVPGFPFRVACKDMLRANSGFGALRSAVNVYYNYTGQAGSCYKMDDMVVSQALVHWGRKGRMDLLYKHREHEKAGIRLFRQRRWGSDGTPTYLQLEEAWGYQTCTEVYQPMPTNGVTDFEIPQVPNEGGYFAYCRKRYDVEPRPDWEEMTFMGSHIQGGSNIFLTSGQLDPWRAAGIQKPLRGTSASIVFRVIENGAHHLDLRAAHPLDPPSVVEVRSEEKTAMRNWIAQWKDMYENEQMEIDTFYQDHLNSNARPK